MSVSLNGTNGLTFADSTTQNTGGYTGFRNRIINGDMRIDQRNAGASVTPATNAYTLDRWGCYLTQTSKFSVQQSSTAPAGFTSSLLVTSLSAYSVAAGDTFFIRQIVEGFNISDFGWGTANAQSVTLSFWVRSSLTGTFGGSVDNSAATYSFPFSFAISAANTWEYKTVTISGQSSGVWQTGNGGGLELRVNLGSGSTFSGTANTWANANYVAPTGATSVVGTSGATFYVTGVQLEKGSVATPFEFRPYGTELQLCQRYCYRQETPVYQNCVYAVGAFQASGQIGVPFPVVMRAAPTVTVSFVNRDNTASVFVSPFGNSVTPHGVRYAFTITYGVYPYAGFDITSLNNAEI